MAEKPLDQELTQTEQRQSRLKELIAKGKEQGYLTYAEVNDHLPEEIADPVKIGFNIPESITFLLTESTSFRVGAVAYPSPPLVTNI